MNERLTARPGRTVVALLLITFGVLALLGVNLLWPMFVLVPGFVFLAVALMGSPATAGLAIPGMLITGTGLLLFIQNLTGYWNSWSYAWALYGVFLGMGLVIMARLTGSDELERVGRGFIMVSSLIFAAFAFLMEIVIGVSGGLGVPGWSILLIGLGLFILLRGAAGKRGLGLSDKPKRKLKNEDKLFTGPVVYGSRRNSTPDYSHLSSSDSEDRPRAR